VQDRLDDIQRRQLEPQQARDIGQVDPLRDGKRRNEVKASVSTTDILAAN
jgi:hypothetical protein